MFLQLETNVLLALQSLRIVGVEQLMALVSALGNAAFVWVVIAVVMLFSARRRSTGIVMLLSVIVCGIVVELVLSNLIARPRPSAAGLGVTAAIGVSKAGYSFPSLHAATSFAAAMAIYLMMGKKQAVPAFVGAALMVFARMYLGVSYFSDVAVGAVLGCLIAVGVAWVYNQYLGQMVNRLFGAPSLRRRASVKTARGGRRASVRQGGRREVLGRRSGQRDQREVQGQRKVQGQREESAANYSRKADAVRQRQRSRGGRRR